MSLKADTVERLKRIDPNDELLTSGYARKNALIDIPFEIIQICIAFLLNVDEWNENNKGKHLKISDDKTKVNRLSVAVGFRYASNAHGKT